MKISKIYVYPIKALRAVELTEVQVTKHGFPHDRRFMMLHVQRSESQENGTLTLKNMAVAHYPKSVLFFPSIDSATGTLTITYKPPTGDHKSIDLPLAPEIEGLEEVDVTMHGSPTKAYRMEKMYNDWLSECYGFEVVLVYLGPNYRPVLMSSSPNTQRQPSSASSTQQNGSGGGAGWLSTITSTASSLLGSAATQQKDKDEHLLTFNDVAPYLIASSTSMSDLLPRLPDSEAQDLDIIKFRPNIIVEGAEEPWDEDYWSQITITSSNSPHQESTTTTTTTTKIECIHNCGRCKSINIDYSTGAPGTNESGQLLKKMQKDRRVDPGVKYSPIFGRYSFLNGDSEGNVIRTGDEVVVSRRNGERTKFDWEGLNTLSS